MKYNFDYGNQKPGDELFKNFFGQNQVLSVRQVEGLSVARTNGLSTEELFLRDMQERHAHQTDTEEMKALLGPLYLACTTHAYHLKWTDLWKTNGTVIEGELHSIDDMALVRFFVGKYNNNSKKHYSHSECITVGEKSEASKDDVASSAIYRASQINMA
ncbi:hypothetical protein HHI36_019784 [Cryptolaemus montrouzieri]|uniref:Uncharacterized protein n=1 Tax=Cryptolaemus montrouzieri TaxID=559131 RepID=A0ABD2N8Q3_9CUCU